MVPWNRDDPDSGQREADLRAVLEGVLESGPAAEFGHRSHSGGVPTLEAFSQELPGAVKAAERHYAAHAETFPPAGSSGALPRLLIDGVGYGPSNPAPPVTGTDHDTGDPGDGDAPEGEDPADDREP